MKRRTLLGGAVAGALAMAGCGGGSNNPLSTSSPAASGSGGGDSLVIGSANFPENELLADIYAGALKAKGVNVSTKLNIGSRETYLPALKDGEIDFIPEYNGNLARYLNKNASITDTATAQKSLLAALPSTLTALNPTPGQDTDSMVVTAQTASQYKLTSIADLKAVAGQLTLGAPSEFKTRIDGIPGLQRVYGVTFKAFRAFDSSGTLAWQALKNNQVQVVNLYSTDPNIAANKFVALTDPKHLFGAQNIVPVVSKAKATSTVSDAVNAVSAKLTTEVIVQLVEKVVIEKQDAATVAQQWLKDNQLG